jgi:HAE1 family hydrophobic/amphiphilic exporter-1
VNATLGVFVRRPVFTWVLVLALVVAGLASLRGLSMERYPNVDLPIVTITTQAPGLSAAQMETEVTTRVENAVGTVAGLERVDSVSQEGQSIVLAQFVLSKEGPVAAQDVRDRVARLSAELPVAARAPQVELFNPNASPILLISLGSRSRTLREVSEVADSRLRRELQTIKGVGDVRVLGSARRMFRIVLDETSLLALDLTVADVQAALVRENLDAPGGTVPGGDQLLALRLDARAASFAEVGELVVAQRGSSPIRVRDVARLVDGEEAPASITTVDGERGVVLAVLKQSGANTLDVTREVRAQLAVFAADPQQAAFSAHIVRDEGAYVSASIDAVYEHLVLGSIFAALVVLLFLRDGRATMIAALAIPSSVVGTFALVKTLGLTLNMMTLLGLTLAVGIVIDDAVVVLENIVRVMRAKNLSPQQAAVEATREISLAVLATTLSLVAVFLPLAVMPGIVGRFLSSFGLTMSVSILLSMFVAFTLTPMLSARWLKAPDTALGPAMLPPAPCALADERSVYASWARGERRVDMVSQEHAHDGKLERGYARLLAWAMQRRWVVFVTMAATLAATVALSTVLPTTFLPAEDEGRFNVYLRFPEGTSVEATSLAAERLARTMRGAGDVMNTVVTAGAPRGDASGRGPHEASLYVTVRAGRSQLPVMERARREWIPSLLPKDVLAIVSPVADLSGEGVDGTTVQYVLTGPDPGTLATSSQALLAEARQIPGTTDHGTTAVAPPREVRLMPDRARAADNGVTQADIGDLVRVLGNGGVEVGLLRDPHDVFKATYPLNLSVGTSPGDHTESARSLTVRGKAGRLLALSELTQPTLVAGTESIRRANRQRQITVFMNAGPGTSEDAVVRRLDQARIKQGLPGTYRGEVVGNAKEMERTVSAFGTAVVLSFIFMYLVLAAQFESWVHPITILVSLPLAVPFALLSLYVGGQSLNLFSMLGFLVLFGIVKKNSILQLDHILGLRRNGLTRADAIIVGNVHRLRPILMTTLAFVVGLLPLVVSRGIGAGTNRSVSIGVAGGQTLALGLTLLATPVVYATLDDLASWLKKTLKSMRSHR